MFRKRLILLCLAAATLFSVGGCGAVNEQDTPRLIIGCGDYEPYNYADENGEAAGIDVDLAEEACRRMGYEPVFKRIDWNNRDSALESGSIDCLWSCFSMDDQEDDYDWVGPYMHSRQIVAVLEDSPIYTFADLEGKSVGVRVASKAESVLLNQNDPSIPEVGMVYSLNSADELATALRNDYVDAIAGYAAAAREVLQNDSIPFRFLDENLIRASFGVAFPKGRNSELRRKLSDALDEMLSDGTVKAILQSYEVETDKALEGLCNE